MSAPPSSAGSGLGRLDMIPPPLVAKHLGYGVGEALGQAIDAGMCSELNRTFCVGGGLGGSGDPVRNGNLLDCWHWYVGATVTRFRHLFLDGGDGGLGKGWGS